MGRVGHESGGIHHSTGRVGSVHVRKAVAIVVGGGVVHPGAHGDRPGRLCATGVSDQQAGNQPPWRSTRGTTMRWRVSEMRMWENERISDTVVMDKSRRGVRWWSGVGRPGQQEGTGRNLTGGPGTQGGKGCRPSMYVNDIRKMRQIDGRGGRCRQSDDALQSE